MSDNIDNLVLEHLKAIRAETGSLSVDMRDIKERLAELGGKLKVVKELYPLCGATVDPAAAPGSDRNNRTLDDESCCMNEYDLKKCADARSLGWEYLNSDRTNNFAKAKRSWRKAERCYRLAAEQGNAEAQYSLGAWYHNGDGMEVDRDDDEAVQWYRKAAEQGHARAQTMLGLMYFSGTSVHQDKAYAVRCWRKAAEQGYANAQHWLGESLADGDGVDKDDAEAAQWLRKAAEQGYGEAWYTLGKMYADDECVFKDVIQAYAWISNASKYGFADAKVDKENLTGKMTHTEIAEARKLSREYWDAFGTQRNS